MWSLESLKKMDPYDFELLIGDLFEAMGYTTNVTPRSRDFGVDILVKLEHIGLSHSWIVQAKKYEGNVGVREIREYGSLRMRDRVDGVIIVTTGNFTKDALDEADQYNLKLINGDILVGMLNRYLHKTLPEKEKIPDPGDILLHQNEEIILREQVFIEGGRFEFILSNKNIFLKEAGFLSKNSTLKHKIPILKTLGAIPEKNGILLFIGGKDIQTIHIKGDEQILDIFGQVKSSALGQSEKLIKYHKSGQRLLVLTNKRLFLNEYGNIWQTPASRISGIEIKGGWLSGNSKVILFITGEDTEQKELSVDDARAWKSDIESAVRSSRVS